MAARAVYGAWGKDAWHCLVYQLNCVYYIASKKAFVVVVYRYKVKNIGQN